MPDLIQTEHVPSKGLARPQNKNKLNEKNKNTKKTSHIQVRKEVVSTVVSNKTKKCQPVAGDMPDLIQTEHVPSKGLARPKNKNKQNEKKKKQKLNDFTNVTLLVQDECTKSLSTTRLKHKIMNKLTKAINGNIKTTIKVIHWNYGE